MIAFDQSGRGEPLALLHGVGASRAVWGRVRPELAARRLVLAPDLPGFGQSAPVGQGFDLRDVALTVADTLAESAGEPFDLVGNSLGGAVALQLAFLRPELVRRLVLCAPAGFAPLPWPVALALGHLATTAVTVRRLVGTPLAGNPIARQALLWGAIAAPQALSPRDAVTMLQASRGSTRVGAAVATVLRADLAPLVREVKVPIGLIWGRRDRVVPISTLDTILALRPDAAVATIADAAHVPQLEQPAEFVRALRRVFQRLAR
jgi:pimeloyl-ACP methyl ester carboxylesterase